MKKIFSLTLAVLTLGLVLTGCKTIDNTIARFSVISSKNVDISNLGNFKRSATKIETKKLSKITLFTEEDLRGNYQLENALDSALENIPGATVMVDAKLHYIIKKRPCSTRYGYVFEGTALIDPTLAAAAKEETSLNTLNGEDELFFIEEDGVQKQVSKDEYNNLIAKL